MRLFSTKAPSDESDDHTAAPRISLEEFYSSIADIELADDKALEYMSFSAKLAMVTFKDQQEMMSFKSDF